MKSKRFIILGLSIMLSLTMKAQEIREITLKKPGKLENSIKKKELNEITKLRVVGPVNCEDITFFSKLNNLKYLDLREIEFDSKNKHNQNECKEDPTCFDFHNASALDEFYAPIKGFDEIEGISANRIHIPFGMSYSGYCLALYIEGNTNQAISEKYNVHTWNNKAYITVDNKSVATQVYDSSNSPLVVIKETGEYLVRKWPFDKISREDFKKISFIEEKAFDYVSLPDTIEFSGNLKKLPPDIFRNAYVGKRIQVLINNGLKEIGSGAFCNNVTEEYYNYKNNSMSNKDVNFVKIIKIPSSVEKFDGNSCIDTIEIESKTPPQWLQNHKRSETIYLIPEGTYKSYFATNPNLNYYYRNPKGSYNINVPQGNSILSYITLEELVNADSLTITGILLEDDFKMLRKAKYLRYLDISNCITDYNPEKYEKWNRERQVVSAIFGAISQKLDDSYNDYSIGTIEYNVNKSIADAISEAYSKGKVEKKCLIPEYALEDMQQLTHVKLPILATSIGEAAFRRCKNLKTVELPPFLTVIDEAAFLDCESLRNIEFPNTIRQINFVAFMNCNSLTKVEFPAMTNTVEMQRWVFSLCTNLTELVLPEGLKTVADPVMKSYNVRKIVIPSTCTYYSLDSRKNDKHEPVPCELHFKCATPPDGSLYYFTEEAPIKVYIPKGTMTKYMSKDYGTNINYIEE